METIHVELCGILQQWWSPGQAVAERGGFTVVAVGLCGRGEDSGSQHVQPDARRALRHSSLFLAGGPGPAQCPPESKIKDSKNRKHCIITFNKESHQHQGML